MAQHETTVYIGLGSNIGDRVARLRESVVHLSRIIEVTRASRLYVQAPLGYVGKDAFINAVVEGRTTLKPFDLMVELQKIERAMGRRRGIQLWSAPYRS
jgi:2-amino-4-hydroxy-6-hydroxymethyldihydropteridine diphosphokinase